MDKTELGNRLLDHLPRRCAQRILDGAKRVELPLGYPLYVRDEPQRFIYFPTSGIGSVVFNSERGTSIELSTQGREGLVGWNVLLGPGATPSDCSMQVGGKGYRVPVSLIQREFDESPALRQRVLEYVQHQAIVASQVVACNRLHRAEARFVRWLLMVSDRIESDDLPMTQEFMSTMLGTRRTTVAEVSSELARAGGLESRRGGLRIVSRAVLEARVCECYRILQAPFFALYSAPLRSEEG